MLIVSQSVATPTDVALNETATYSQLQAVNEVNLESVYICTHKINYIIIRFARTPINQPKGKAEKIERCLVSF